MPVIGVVFVAGMDDVLPRSPGSVVRDASCNPPSRADCLCSGPFAGNLNFLGDVHVRYEFAIGGELKSCYVLSGSAIGHICGFSLEADATPRTAVFFTRVCEGIVVVPRRLPPCALPRPRPLPSPSVSFSISRIDTRKFCTCLHSCFDQ